MFTVCLYKNAPVLPKHSLDVDDGLGVGHVVLLSAHGALLVHNHQVVGVDYSTLEQIVQAGPFTKQQSLLRHVRKYLSLDSITIIKHTSVKCNLF